MTGASAPVRSWTSSPLPAIVTPGRLSLGFSTYPGRIRRISTAARTILPRSTFAASASISSGSGSPSGFGQRPSWESLWIDSA